MNHKFTYEVAMFVGAALNHPLPPCNGNGNISTIHVAQYKTKFDDIRIYCDLASPELVLDLWKSMGKVGEPDEKFNKECLWADAQHYRYCYISMINILNDEDIISSLKEPANYPELLFSKPEDLDKFLNENLEKSLKYPQYINNFYDKWKVEDFDSLRKFLYKISGFGVPA